MNLSSQAQKGEKMKESAILMEVLEGRIARITLNRPASFNAYNLEMARQLQDRLERCARDERIEVLVLTGSGKAFCSGGDLREMQSFLDKGKDSICALFQELTRYLHVSIVEMRRMAKPIVAAVNGPAAGAGFSLAMACDMVIASREASFVQAYTRIGLTPDGGSSFFLPRLIGPARAAELMFLNRVITAQEALELGLVSRVVEPEALEEESVKIARELAQGPMRAFGILKRLLKSSLENGLEGQLEEERRGILEASMTQEFREGLRAFLDKRPPRFSAAP